MKSLKKIATLTALSAALCTSMLAMAEPTPPKGTTVNSIELTTVQTNMRASDGQMMPAMNSTMDTSSGAQMGSMSSNMHSSMPAADADDNSDNNMDNNMGTPMTSDMDTDAPVTSPQVTTP